MRAKLPPLAIGTNHGDFGEPVEAIWGHDQHRAAALLLVTHNETTALYRDANLCARPQTQDIKNRSTVSDLVRGFTHS